MSIRPASCLVLLVTFSQLSTRMFSRTGLPEREEIILIDCLILGLATRWFVSLRWFDVCRMLVLDSV